jgi:hypothetical protein
MSSFKALFINLCEIFQKYSCQAKYPALTGYPAGYSVSGFWISRISSKMQKQYSVHS